MTDSIEKDLENKNFIEFMNDRHEEIKDGKIPVENIKKEVANYFKTKNKKEKDLEQTLIDAINDCRKRDYNTVINEHKTCIANGGLITGWKCVDDKLVAQKTDFIVMQGMSSHGKSTFMNNLEYRYLNIEENKSRDVMCVHIGYEANKIRTEQNLINIISYELEKNIAIKFDRNIDVQLFDDQKRKGNYLYIANEKNKKAIELYNKFIEEERLIIMKKLPSLEQVSKLIDLLKLRHPNRTLVLFLYFVNLSYF